MLVLQNLTKIFKLHGRHKVICENLNFTFPSGVSVALMGRNGAGKTSLLRMISGSLPPSSGEILTDGTISWPVGFSGSFHAELTGAQNVRFLARLYGADTDQMVDFVEDFAELGTHFHLPFRSYSSGMKARLAFGASMAIPFDIYLVDEVTAVGDTAFRDKSKAFFKNRMERAGAFVVAHNTSMLKDMCDVGLVLEGGQATYYEDLTEAIAVHEANMKAAPVAS